MSFFKNLFSMFGDSKPSIQFGDGERFDVDKGTSILQVALDKDVELEHFCEGTCSCSTCRVEIIKGGENLSKIQPDEAAMLGEKRVASGDRLSCQAKINGEVHVRIPDLF